MFSATMITVKKVFYADAFGTIEIVETVVTILVVDIFGVTEITSVETEIKLTGLYALMA